DADAGGGARGVAAVAKRPDGQGALVDIGLATVGVGTAQTQQASAGLAQAGACVTGNDTADRRKIAAGIAVVVDANDAQVVGQHRAVGVGAGRARDVGGVGAQLELSVVEDADDVGPGGDLAAGDALTDAQIGGRG